MDDIRLSLKAPASFSKKLLALTGFSGEEPISRPFQFQLSFVSDNLDLSAKDAIGANVTVILDHAQGQSRPFNGVIRSIVAGDSGLTTTRLYRAEMVPWLWFLTRGSDCRIFEDCTALDIITEVITDHHQSVDTSGVKGAAPKQKRPYCVQYRETDFHFISRLMEEVGIFYAFKHDDGRHSLYLYDSVSAYTDIPGKTLGYSPARNWRRRSITGPGISTIIRAVGLSETTISNSPARRSRPTRRRSINSPITRTTRSSITPAAMTRSATAIP